MRQLHTNHPLQSFYKKTKQSQLALMERKIPSRFFHEMDWGDSRRNLLEGQKIGAPKKNSTFAFGF